MAIAIIDWTDVTDLAPALATGVASSVQALILALANESFDGRYLSDAQANLARVNLAAHLGTLEKRRATSIAGPMTSESVGGVSRSFAAIASSGVFVGTTFGDALTMILRTSNARLPMVLC